VLPQDKLEAVRARYREPHRSHHTERHLDEMLSLFDELRGRFKHPVAVLAAIYWHDAVYDPARSDNEAASAALLVRDLTGSTGRLTVARAASLVMATREHAVPDGMSPGLAADCALFLDTDMWVLGSPPERYAEYETGIEREYQPLFGRDAYRFGRIEFLTSTLKRGHLFLTPYFATRHTRQARENMARAIDNLRMA
jgi:predicted metal-dependent HD superfamily phosphohydrolase